MRRASPARLEKLFALIVTVAVPASGMLGMAACGSTTTGASSEDGGGASSSGASSGGGSSGSGSSSGSSSSGACGGCGGCGDPTYVTVTDAGALVAPADAGDPGNGDLPGAVCSQVCGSEYQYSGICWLTDAGSPPVVACQQLCLGRRPQGYRGGEAHALTELGAHFARVAQLEAASVPAFRRMARELSRLGAPRKLVKAAERAAREELRHARGATALARKYGAAGATFGADARGERSLEEFAIENAVEGCVRETYGALVATWQAREARDPHVRAHMARVAKEETTHAALAWKADAWARGRLAKDARARVEEARAKAARALVVEAAAGESAADVARAAGVPDARTARRMASELSARLAA